MESAPYENIPDDSDRKKEAPFQSMSGYFCELLAIRLNSEDSTIIQEEIFTPNDVTVEMLEGVNEMSAPIIATKIDKYLDLNSEDGRMMLAKEIADEIKNSQ